MGPRGVDACRVTAIARTPTPGRTNELIRAARHLGEVVCFGVLPAALIIAVLASTFGRTTFAYDFHGGLYNAARDILHDHDPYRPGYLAFEAGRHLGGAQPAIDVPVYPPPVLLAAVPFALLPFKLAALLFAGISIAAPGRRAPADGRA